MRTAALVALFAAIVPWLALAEDAAPSDVIDLTGDTFESIVPTEDMILVEFYAPWCGHCKALAPHYEEAATALKDKNVKLAKVDCVEHSELCGKHDVAGYPTLKVFRKGTPTEYKGPRKADGIISYMLKQSLPAVSDVTAANLEEFSHADKLVVVAFVSKAADIPIFSEVAEKHRDNYLFGLTSDEAAIKAAGVTPPAIVLYKAFDEGRDDFPVKDVASATVEQIENFVKSNALPLFGEVDADTYGTYAQTALPLGYLFVDPNEPEKVAALIKDLTPVAKKYKGKVNFATINAIKFSDHAKALNLAEDKWPSFAIQDLTDQLKYPLDQSVTPDHKSLADFVERYTSGKLEPSLKSEAVPENQDGPVHILVGTQFDEVIFDDKKDVFVEFYAPWCGHCKRLSPIWDTLGERYQSIKDKINIVKMDATANDIPPSAPFRVSGFPTIKFKPAGSREFVDYEGDRSLENMIEFIEANAKNSLELPASATKVAEPEAAAETQEAHITDEL